MKGPRREKVGGRKGGSKRDTVSTKRTEVSDVRADLSASRRRDKRKKINGN